MISASGTASVGRPATADPLVEVAQILAAGILQLRARATLGAIAPPEISPDSTPERLEVPKETVLSVHTG